ncbi:hypothetical protein QM012_007514 [Aureobasidium pullulans]|uniref:Centrosomin N-terminal motif 1 domain-containing protein n=1 Tax=Aureobasidium pullulans TaxID=5580 RepID=A0ABR0TP03_AURPU
MSSPAPLAGRAGDAADNSDHSDQESHHRVHQQTSKQPADQPHTYHAEEQDYSDQEFDHEHDAFSPQHDDLYDQDDSDLPPLPMSSDSLLHLTNPHSDVYDEREMRRKLMDVESSFMPDLLSARVPNERTGADDTYLNIKHQQDSDIPPIHEQTEDDIVENDDEEEEEEGEEDEVASITSAPAIQPSSPAAAAAERSSMRAEPVRRVSENDQDLSTAFTRLTLRSNASKDADQGASSRNLVQPSFSEQRNPSSSFRETARSSKEVPQGDPPQQPEHSFLSTTSASTKPEDVPLPISDRSLLDTGSLHSASSRLQKRPSYTSQRNPSHLSAMSNADTEYSAGDYALQTGGAIPEDHSFSHGRPLSRLPSLGSVVSAMSRDSEPNPPPLNRGNSVLASIRAERALENLEEEDKVSIASDPVTPRPPDMFEFHAPTDTIITRHVQNIQVPDTVAKEYRQQNRPISPDKRPASSSNALTFGNRPGGNLTLKEQNSKIDKLTKENFDLKLKIHFLDQALQNRSEEGVKDMINKNVQFQTDLANERKENQSLRRKIRDLEKRLKQSELDLAEARKAAQEAAGNGHEELEYEILQLSEELDRKTIQIAHLTAENMAKEVEKRKMKEYMTAMNERRGSEHDIVEEESEMWKDLLTTETARREQAEEDIRKLREEVIMLRSEKASEASRGLNINRMSIHRSQSTGSENLDSRSGAISASSSTLVEQLQHEIAELRRDLGAQTSMLTSRNRERERLQQEIEDLKLLHRKVEGGRSMTGDSIFDRSVSRQNQYQRSTSRTSGQTQGTMSDAERDGYEQREGILRDQNAALRLDFQDMQRQFNEQTELIAELEEAVQISENELDAAVEDLRTVQNQRNEAIQQLEATEIELEQVKADHEKLRIEAVSAIEDLEDSLDKTEQGRERIASDLKDREDDFKALQRELHSLNDSLVQLEDDRTAAMKRIEMLEQELEDANTELDEMEKNLRETALKNSRLDVQAESLHNEISFLREEQEGDKIKIGDLENNLAAAQQMIQDEKEKMQELEESLVEERRQREIVDNQSKQDVQKMIDDLNDENAKSKDEVRSVKQTLRQAETESTKYKTRLEELETNLRRVLGDRRSGWLQEIQRMQDELENTIVDLGEAKAQLAEKDRLLRNRDQLLESSGLESKRLSEMLEKERSLRRKDLHQFEQSQRGNSTNARMMAQHESRALDLETARSQDRRKMMQLEQQYRDQLVERNQLLFTLWTKLSTLCGNAWASNHSIINGEPTSIDSISHNLQPFTRNILSAIKTIETLMSNCKAQIRSVEKNLRKDYQVLEQNLDVRVKKMEFLERAVKDAQSAIEVQAQESAQLRSQQNMNRSTKTSVEEVAKLKQEIKILKAEIRFYKSAAEKSTAKDTAAERKDTSNQLTPRASMANSLLRHHSSSAIEVLQGQNQPPASAKNPSIVIATPPIQPSEQRWIHRLKELERRLKAEREGRLLDRKGARQRLEERDSQLEDLRGMLEREKDRRGSIGSSQWEEGGEEGRSSRLSRVSGRTKEGRERDGSVD